MEIIEVSFENDFILTNKQKKFKKYCRNYILKNWFKINSKFIINNKAHIWSNFYKINYQLNDKKGYYILENLNYDLPKLFNFYKKIPLKIVIKIWFDILKEYFFENNLRFNIFFIIFNKVNNLCYQKLYSEFDINKIPEDIILPKYKKEINDKNFIGLQIIITNIN